MSTASTPALQKTAIGVAGVICLLFGIKTFTRNFTWKDDFTLFLTDVKTSENSIYKTENSFGDKWVELEEYREKREETQTYVFGYKDALGSFKATEPLFDKVQLKNIIENEIDPEQLQEINIKAYAIQSENIPGQTGGNDLSQEELTQIYQMIESE